MKNIKTFIFLSNATGGIATYQSNIINFLAKKNHNTLLIDKKFNQTENNVKKKLKNHKLIFVDLLWNFLEGIKVLKEIKKKKTKENIFIISNTVIFSIYFPIIKLFFKKTKILLVYHSHLYNFNFVQIFFGLISSIFSLMTYRILFVSKFTMRWWNTYFPLTKLANKSVIYNYVNISKTVKRKKPNKLNVGFVGRLEKEKGIHTFTNITKNITNPCVKFHIFGEGSIKLNKKYLKKIKIYKWTKRDQIYKKINILFVTSEIENCPLNVLEAKSYGIPTITISNGGIKEIIQNNKDGFILGKNTSYVKIEDKLIKVLNNYKFYSNNCVKNSKKFDVKNYETFLKTIDC